MGLHGGVHAVFYKVCRGCGQGLVFFLWDVPGSLLLAGSPCKISKPRTLDFVYQEHIVGTRGLTWAVRLGTRRMFCFRFRVGRDMNFMYILLR